MDLAGEVLHVYCINTEHVFTHVRDKGESCLSKKKTKGQLDPPLNITHYSPEVRAYQRVEGSTLDAKTQALQLGLVLHNTICS